MNSDFLCGTGQEGIALAQEYAEELATAINRNLSGIVASIHLNVNLLKSLIFIN